MRLVALALVFLGIVATAAGAVVGCTTIFASNERHRVAAHELPLEAPLGQSFQAKRGTRYTLGVQVVFDREGLPEKDGALVVEARLPLVAVVKDAAGEEVAKAVGWLDPAEPPTFLSGHAAHFPRAMKEVPELVAERLVGPFTSPRDEAMRLEVRLGGDVSAAERPGATPSRIAKTRVVLYDDALPGAVVLAVVVAVLGLGATLAGVALLMSGLFRKRRGKEAR